MLFISYQFKEQNFCGEISLWRHKKGDLGTESRKKTKVGRAFKRGEGPAIREENFFLMLLPFQNRN